LQQPVSHPKGAGSKHKNTQTPMLAGTIGQYTKEVDKKVSAWQDCHKFHNCHLTVHFIETLFAYYGDFIWIDRKFLILTEIQLLATSWQRWEHSSQDTEAALISSKKCFPICLTRTT
jgi:hypothetical protein